MKEILYLEVPNSDTEAVCTWLQQQWLPSLGQKVVTPTGIRLQFSNTSPAQQTIPEKELAIFVWSTLQTTYLKVFQWSSKPFPQQNKILQQLTIAVGDRFEQQYPEPPEIDLSKQSIFEALESYYPHTVKFFQKMPKGEYDLNRVYWWERRWRESVRNPREPKQVVFQNVKKENELGQSQSATYDLIYIGGALGVIHAAVMAKLGYRVLVIDRLPFGRMNREWNISRDELQSLVDLDLLTVAEMESVIANEYIDGFTKFFDGNNPPHLKAKVLHTPKVLNIAIDSEGILSLCGDKLRQAGGEIWDETEFIRADVAQEQVTIQLVNLPNGELKQVSGRLLIDAMGSASPIAWQLNGGRAFDSICPTVGAVVDQNGFASDVWDSNYGDLLYSSGDISRGRQLIWELFPGGDDDLVIYLFHYHEVHPDNPGSLLEMYEDFFACLPEYRRCDIENLEWKKATFGYIPGHFSVGSSDRQVAFDRLLAIGDAASLQSPLIFTGFGSLLRNLGRLTTLLDTALKHDLLDIASLNQIRAYQSNISVTWLFSKGMMVPTGKTLPPQRINTMLNTFFGVLAEEPQEVADTFIKDRINWLTFNQLALKAARKNPALIWWIWEMAGSKDMIRWLGSYLTFTLDALLNFFLMGWFPNLLQKSQSWLESKYPGLWLRLLSFTYTLTIGTGNLSRK